jgi:hypothetical protein
MEKTPPEEGEALPDIIPVSRPKVEDQIIKDPHWLSGFIAGEGCFYVQRGSEVILRFSIAQHIRDTELMESLISHLGCGRLAIDPKNYAVYLVVIKFSDIESKIIPFFTKDPFHGTKLADYIYFCKVAELIKGAHLTQ